LVISLVNNKNILDLKEIHQAKRAWFFKYLTPIAFEIIIFHIMIYEVLSFRNNNFDSSIFYTVLRIFLINLVMIFFLGLVNQILLIPLIRLSERLLGLDYSDDHHI